MHFTTLLTIALFPFALAAPFRPQQGSLQSHRRRAVDYPLQLPAHNADAPSLAIKANADTPILRRRALMQRELPYSVVQVDGSSGTPAAVAAATSATEASGMHIETIAVSATDSTATPTDTTSAMLSVSLTETGAETTPTPIIDVSGAPSITLATSGPVAPTSAPAAASGPKTAQASSNNNSNASTLVTKPSPKASSVQAPVRVETAVVTVVETAAPAPSSVSYYDNGLWHTWYPVKEFGPGTKTAPAAAVASTSAA